MEHWVKRSICLGIVMFFVFAGLGCSTTQKTTQTETVVTSSDQVATIQGENGQTTVVTTTPAVQSSQTTNTTTTETKPTGHPGILSSTVHAIGWVIALPFRLVGGLIGWIF